MVLNQAFREPLRHGELDFLEGAKVRIKVTDLCIDWLIRVGADRFSPSTGSRMKMFASVARAWTLSCWLPARPIRIRCFFQRRIRIEGDTELGLGVKNTMDSMDWDDLPMPLRRFLQGVGRVIEKFYEGT